MRRWRTVLHLTTLTLTLFAAPSADAISFSNPSAISIPSNGSANPYPSTLTVAGVPGTVNDINVTLHGLSHEFPADLDVLLVGPGGESVLLMSDIGGGTDIIVATLVFDDSALTGVPNPVVSGVFKPTNTLGGDNFHAPAPSGPYGSQLSVFNGGSANGIWRLFVFDDGLFAAGSIANGWSLAINSSNGSSTVPEPPVIILGIGFLMASFWLRRNPARKARERAQSMLRRIRFSWGRIRATVAVAQSEKI